MVEVNTPRVRAALIQPGHAAISLQRAQHAARMRHQQNRKLRERMQEQQVQVISHMQKLTYEMERQQKTGGAGAGGDGMADLGLCKRTPGCSKPYGHMGWCAGHSGFYNRRSAPPPPPSIAMKEGLAGRGRAAGHASRSASRQRPERLGAGQGASVDDSGINEEERAQRLLQQHASLMQQQAALLGQVCGGQGGPAPHMLPLPQGAVGGVPPHMLPLQLAPGLLGPGGMQVLMAQQGLGHALAPGITLAAGMGGVMLGAGVLQAQESGSAQAGSTQQGSAQPDDKPQKGVDLTQRQ